jgi:hypothetical protein
VGSLGNSFHRVLTKDCPGILLLQTLRLSDIFLLLKLCIICRTRFFPLQSLLLKVHKHEIFVWLFLSKPKLFGPKGLSQEIFDNRIRFGRDIWLSAYAQHAMKLFPRMLSVRWNSYVSVSCLLFSFPNIRSLFSLSPILLSMQFVALYWFRVCSACDEIISVYAQHAFRCPYKNCRNFIAHWSYAKICWAYAQCAMKSFPRMLSVRLKCKFRQ